MYSSSSDSESCDSFCKNDSSSTDDENDSGEELYDEFCSEMIDTVDQIIYYSKAFFTGKLHGGFIGEGSRDERHKLLEKELVNLLDMGFIVYDAYPGKEESRLKIQTKANNYILRREYKQAAYLCGFARGKVLRDIVNKVRNNPEIIAYVLKPNGRKYSFNTEVGRHPIKQFTETGEVEHWIGPGPVPGGDPKVFETSRNMVEWYYTSSNDFTEELEEELKENYSWVEIMDSVYGRKEALWRTLGVWNAAATVTLQK